MITNCRLLLIFLFSSFAMGCAFDAGHDCNEDEMRYAAEMGKKDAMEVVKTDATSMDHENAILSIRAKEEELRKENYQSAADAYVDAAEATLRSEGVIP